MHLLIKNDKQKQVVYFRCFIFIWTVVNIWQAKNTQLLDDEAYYWTYSKFLDWGYFDHPPMIALLIKIGYTIFPNELGVRLILVLMSSGLLWICRVLTKNVDFSFYLVIALSFLVLHIGSILAVPDTPLIFFTGVYLLIYQKFLIKKNLLYAFLLGLVAAALLYSKYHGILVIFFSILGVPKILKQKYIYIAAVVCILLFLPHIFWQINHHFPSIRYHLIERNEGYHFDIDITLEYILGQIIFLGPLIGILSLWVILRKKVKDAFLVSLKYMVFGILTFFLISTLKGRVEANWTAPALVCMLILSCRLINEVDKLKKWIKWIFAISLILAIIARVIMVVELWPGAMEIKEGELYRNHEWAQQIKKEAKSKKVIFINSYQKASKYWFYTKDTSYSYNTANARKNAYNFFPLRSSFDKKEILMIISDSLGGGWKKISTVKGNLFMKEVKNFSLTDSLKL